MVRKFLPLFTLAPALVGLCSCGGRGTVSPPPPVGIKIMPLGDSITAGQGLKGGYRLLLGSELASKFSFTFVGSLRSNSGGWHEGHAGWQIRDFIGESKHSGGKNPAPVTRFIRAVSPDVVLLLIGTNDGAIGETEFARRYRVLLDDVYAVRPDVKIAFMEVIPNKYGDTDAPSQARAAAETVTAEYRAKGKAIVLIDPRSRFDYTTMMKDVLHPNATGYGVLADLFEPAVESLLQPIASP